VTAAANDEPPIALRLRAITKRYGPVTANADVTLTLRRGSVHAVLGENGAGKSTLMKILFGVERPDSGTIEIDGEQRLLRSPRDAIAVGVGMVFQHFGLVQQLTALDNISLGAEVSGLLGVQRSAAADRISRLAADVGLQAPLDRRVADLSIAQQQRVEILKALYRGARILILDEPTALLAPQERLGLFEAIKRLQATGTSVLFITHKLDEAEHLADEVTVMRLGRVVARHTVGEVTAAQLIADMVGRAAAAPLPPSSRSTGPVGVRVIGMTTAALEQPYPLQGVDLDVRRGEIVGVVGIDGHGHQTLCQALAGVRPLQAGTIELDGARQHRFDRATAMRHAVAYVPEDRLVTGVARNESIADNLIANRLGEDRFVRFGMLRRRSIAAHADQLISRFDIRCRDRDQVTADLSGGNVQKVVLAREISTDPAVLVVCEPTRGLDIGAIGNVHRQLGAAAADGAAVVVQSSDLDEVLEIADRIVVFREGRIVGDVRNGDAVDAIGLGALMLGPQAQDSA